MKRFLLLAAITGLAVCTRAAMGAVAHVRCVNPVTGAEAPYEAQPNLEFAQQYLAAGLVAPAVPCLENAHQLDPGALTTAYDLGRAYLDTGDVAAARTLIESQLRIADSAKLHNLLGAIDVRQLQYREAAAQFQIAAQQDQSEQYVFDFGTSLLRFAGPSAEDIFRFGISKYPSSVRMHLGLAYALWAQEQVAPAVEEMCAAARIDPADPRTFQMLGDLEQIPPSLRAEITERLATLTRRYPSNGELLYYYAMSLSGVWSGEDLSHLDAVAPMLRHAMVLDPKLAGPHVYLARRAEEKGQNAEALDHYRQAAALKPEDAQIAYRLAFAYKAAGDQEMFHQELLHFKALNEEANRSSMEAAQQLEKIR